MTADVINPQELALKPAGFIGDIRIVLLAHKGATTFSKKDVLSLMSV